MSAAVIGKIFLFPVPWSCSLGLGCMIRAGHWRGLCLSLDWPAANSSSHGVRIFFSLLFSIYVINKSLIHFTWADMWPGDLVRVRLSMGCNTSKAASNAAMRSLEYEQEARSENQGLRVIPSQLDNEEWRDGLIRNDMTHETSRRSILIILLQCENIV